MLGVVVFHDHVTLLNVLGLVLAIFGSALYKITRAQPSSRTGERDGGKDERWVPGWELWPVVVLLRLVTNR